MKSKGVCSQELSQLLTSGSKLTYKDQAITTDYLWPTDCKEALSPLTDSILLFSGTGNRRNNYPIELMFKFNHLSMDSPPTRQILNRKCQGLTLEHHAGKTHGLSRNMSPFLILKPVCSKVQYGWENLATHRPNLISHLSIWASRHTTLSWPQLLCTLFFSGLAPDKLPAA